jgi:hypothetical protein
MLMPVVRKPASTETAVQSCRRVGVDSVLRADPRALPAHTAVSPSGRRKVKRQRPCGLRLAPRAAHRLDAACADEVTERRQLAG